MSVDCTVVIPVGPLPVHQRWLAETIQSVREQTHEVRQILIIDDMAGIPWSPSLTIWHAPWRLGVASAFNCGVALAQYELVFMLGSDDWIEPTCIEECVSYYETHCQPKDEYMAVPIFIHREDGSVTQELSAANAAMVTKTLWRNCGGFPLASTLAAPDAALHQVFADHPEAGKVIMIGDNPLYHYRYHKESATALLRDELPKIGHLELNGEPLSLLDLVRKLSSEFWCPPAWGRLRP